MYEYEWKRYVSWWQECIKCTAHGRHQCKLTLRQYNERITKDSICKSLHRSLHSTTEWLLSSLVCVEVLCVYIYVSMYTRSLFVRPSAFIHISYLLRIKPPPHSYIFNLIPNKNYNKLLSMACRLQTHTHTRITHSRAQMGATQSEFIGNGE